MLKAILVDMDNTLIETQVLYKDAEDCFVRAVCGMGPFDQAEVLQYFHDEQIALFATLGYAASMLPQSYENTLLHYVPDATAAEIAAVRDISRQVFERAAELKHGIEAAIEDLAKHYDIYLVTVGDQAVQQSRVDILPFKETFSGIFIVDHKDASTYRHVLQTIGVNADEAVMIGDSLKSDIIPAVQNGMSAIYIPADNWTAREVHGTSLPEKGVVTHDTFANAVISLIAAKPGAARKFKPPQPPSL